MLKCVPLALREDRRLMLSVCRLCSRRSRRDLPRVLNRSLCLSSIKRQRTKEMLRRSVGMNIDSSFD